MRAQKNSRQKSSAFLERKAWKTAFENSAELKTSDIHVLRVLADHMNSQQKCWPKVERIARLAHVSTRTAIRALKRVVAAGWIERERRYIGQRRTSNMYWMTWSLEEGEEEVEREGEEASVSDKLSLTSSDKLSSTILIVSTVHAKNRAAAVKRAAKKRAAAPAKREAQAPHVAAFYALWATFMAGHQKPVSRTLKTHSPELLVTALAWLIHRCNTGKIHYPHRFFFTMLNIVKTGEKPLSRFDHFHLGAIANGTHPLHFPKGAQVSSPYCRDGFLPQSKPSPLDVVTEQGNRVERSPWEHLESLFIDVDKFCRPNGTAWIIAVMKNSKTFHDPEVFDAWCRKKFYEGKDMLVSVLESIGKPLPHWLDLLDDI